MAGFSNEPFFKSLPSFVPIAAVSVVPDVNVVENPENFLVELAAPGLERNDFKVEVRDGILTISAEKEDEKSKQIKVA